MEEKRSDAAPIASGLGFHAVDRNSEFRVSIPNLKQFPYLTKLSMGTIFEILCVFSFYGVLTRERGNGRKEKFPNRWACPTPRKTVEKKRPFKKFIIFERCQKNYLFLFF